MKNFKKIMALIIAAVMIVGTMSSMTVFAENVPRSITIDGLDKDDEVKFYKVLSWADTTDIATANGAVSGWYFEAPFNTASNIAKNNDKGAAYLKDAINDKNQLYLTDAMANDLAQALNGASVDPINKDDSNRIAGTDGKVTYNFQEADANSTEYDGLYMAIITPKDQDVVYNPVFVHLDSSKKTDSFSIVESTASYMNASTDETGKIVGGAAKKSRIILEKESHSENDYTDATDSVADPVDDGDTTAPYDVLDFTVKTTIPGYGETFDYPVFNMTDKMNGLHLMYPGAESGTYTNAEGEEKVVEYDHEIVVTVGDDEYKVTTLTEGAYENGVFKLTADADQYKIEFNEDFLKTVHVPTAVKVDYKAVVQEGENNNVVKEKNTVTLEFSHDPTTESDSNKGGDKQYKKDVTNHYTFTIDANNLIGPNGVRPGQSGSELVKVAVDKSGNPIFESWTWSNVGQPKTSGQKSPLANAKFKLYGVDANGNIDKNNVVGEATSDASGRINFTGLDAGKYFLEETEAPAGYVKQSGTFPVVIEAEMAEKEITEYTMDGETWISKADYDALDANAKKAYQSFTYKTDELKTYKVLYGTAAEQASGYTFDHIHESDNSQINWSIAESAEAPQSILNTKGVELPSTGGIGTTLFYIIGAILVVGAGIVLVTRRRMSAN